MPSTSTEHPSPKPSKRARAGKGNGPIPEAPPELEELPEEPAKEDFAAYVDGDGTTAEASSSTYAEIQEAIHDQDDGGIEVEEINVSYPRRKPSTSKKRPEFFRTHTDLALWVKTYVVVDRMEMEETVYLVLPKAKPALAEHLIYMQLVPCINTKGKVFLWPIACDDESLSRRKSPWAKSAREAATAARDHWIKILADSDEGKYRPFKAKGPIADPEWPEDFCRQTMLERAFKDHIIRDEDHPVAREFIYGTLKK